MKIYFWDAHKTWINMLHKWITHRWHTCHSFSPITNALGDFTTHICILYTILMPIFNLHELTPWFWFVRLVSDHGDHRWHSGAIHLTLASKKHPIYWWASNVLHFFCHCWTCIFRSNSGFFLYLLAGSWLVLIGNRFNNSQKEQSSDFVTCTKFMMKVKLF